MQYRILTAVSFAGFLSLLAACSEQEQPAQGQTPPPQPIDVAEVVVADVVDWSQFTTRLESPHEVELRPRVSGVIESIEFVEGAVVKKNDLLFKLDPRPFAAEVSRLKAQQKAAEAALKQAALEAKRSERLRESKAISAEDADARGFLKLQREAELSAIESQLYAAQLNLEFTQIRSPLNGRVSRAFIQPGNTVTASDSVLTNLVSTDEVHAYFDIDERTWNAKFNQVTAESGLAVYLQLAGESGFLHQGELDFVDNSVDFSTGTLRVRASFETEGVNQTQLRPGAFARVRLAPAEVASSVLVPEAAIGTDLKNRFILVVGENNLLEYRMVTLGARVGSLRVVSAGLQAGDRIAVNGPARVGPGMPIQPREVEIDTSLLAPPEQTRVNSAESSSVLAAD